MKKETLNNKSLSKDDNLPKFTYSYCDPKAIMGSIERIKKNIEKKGSPFKHLLPDCGDVCFYDSQEDKLVIARDWNKETFPLERFEPTGIVVIPAAHDVYGNGKCGVVSLRCMSYETPDEGWRCGENRYNDKGWFMCPTIWWGHKEKQINKGYEGVITFGSCGCSVERLKKITKNGHLPVENGICDLCLHDENVRYYDYHGENEDLYACTSPYLTDGTRNPLYHQEKVSEDNNALSDFDGINNTKNILSNVNVNGWQTSEKISNSCDEGNYPAAMCCWRYHTKGTKQGDWYLPACGELGYVAVRQRTISKVVNKLEEEYNLQGEFLDFVGSTLWTSTEYADDENYAYIVDPWCGLVGKLYKNTNNDISVRAFLQI